MGNSFLTWGSSYAAPLAAGFTESTMYWMLPCSEVAHLTKSNAWSGYFVNAPMAMLMPPSGGLLGWPATVAG